MKVAQGDVAPTFTLTDQDGRRWSLEEHRGRPVVVYFFPKADTPGCTTQACDVRDSWAAFDDLGAEVVGISPDTPADMAAFAGRYGLPHRLLGDPDRVAIGAYGVEDSVTVQGRTFEVARRSSVVVDPAGRVAAVFDPIAADEQSTRTLAVARRLVDADGGTGTTTGTG